jgi:hypothetical protein
LFLRFGAEKLLTGIDRLLIHPMDYFVEYNELLS